MKLFIGSSAGLSIFESSTFVLLEMICEKQDCGSA